MQTALAQFRRFFLENCVHRLYAGVAFERALACDHFVEDRAEAENIGTVVKVVSAHLLGRHIAHRAHDGSRLGWMGHCRIFARGCPAGLFCQAEIQNFYPAVFGEKDVVRLQVAVNDAFFVRGRQSLRNFNGVFCDLALGQRPGIHFFAESEPFQKLGY